MRYFTGRRDGAPETVNGDGNENRSDPEAVQADQQEGDLGDVGAGCFVAGDPMNTSQWGVASRMIITHREIKLGDTISLMFVGGGWDNAKAIKVTDSQITLCRPWMDSNDGYPRVNLEIFEIWRDSDKTVALLDRVQE